ncbi:MAG TPA: hypothetical protein VJW20_17540 [Candidatus Angelobacter sp.]|nr:hypothetical protein [Candidatus Angelobacter sp.]
MAKTFIPLPQFSTLVQTQHSLLMGPRGCGKTTLLKMLTRGAQQYWHNQRLKAEPALKKSFEKPDFEAIYIPSDVRWSYELGTVKDSIIVSDMTLSSRVQRALVSLTSFTEATHAFDGVLNKDPNAGEKLGVALADHFKLSDVVPTLAQLRLWADSFASSLRSVLVEDDAENLRLLLGELPHSFLAHTLDPLIAACTVFKETIPRKLQPKRWAFCFDELEIAPKWLQDELLGSYRSTPQEFLYKYTWSPVLPQIAIEKLQQKADYAPIRIWFSHPSDTDAKKFCRNFATRLLRDKLNDQRITPAEVFGSSAFAVEDKPGERDDVYAQGSDIWHAMVDLASHDKSFEAFLVNRANLNPLNPVTADPKVRDEILRKIKPIVLLRDTFRGEQKKRSRKRPALYAGEEAIYAMSDGNPRWLAGLLTDLLDIRGNVVDFEKTRHIPLSQQTSVLRAASERMKTFVKNYPRRADLTHIPRLSLADIVDHMAKFFQSQLLGEEFQADPSSSVYIARDTPDEIVDEIDRGLLIGALISVGASSFDVPASIADSRVRLSFMLSPAYKLLLRNYRPVSLDTVLEKKDPRQLQIFISNEET